MDTEAETMAGIDLVKFEEKRYQASAPKNMGAEDEYWKGAPLSAEGAQLGHERVELSKLASRLDEVWRKVADMEYKLEVHMNTLDDLAHRI